MQGQKFPWKLFSMTCVTAIPNFLHQFELDLTSQKSLILLQHPAVLQNLPRTQTSKCCILFWMQLSFLQQTPVLQWWGLVLLSAAGPKRFLVSGCSSPSMYFTLYFYLHRRGRADQMDLKKLNIPVFASASHKPLALPGNPSVLHSDQGINTGSTLRYVVPHRPA